MKRPDIVLESTVIVPPYGARPQFRAITKGRPLTRDEQAEVQRFHGYDPAGYDMGKLTSEVDHQSTNGVYYRNTWHCSGSCE